MDIRPAIQLQSVIKSLRDAVIPAVDPANKMAVEQAHLIAMTLELVASRLALQYRYDRDELVHLTRTVDCLLDASGNGSAVTALAAANNEAKRVVRGACTAPDELENAILSLREKVGAVVAEVDDSLVSDPRSGIGAIILDAARVQIEKERSWLISMGFEPEPAVIPVIETLLDPVG